MGAIECHVSVKTQGEVAVGSGTVLAQKDDACN
jgi:hypothetical protein